MSLSMDYNAVKSITYNLSRMSYDLKKRGEVEIKRCAEDLLEKAIELAPMDTGALRESGKVKKKSNSEYEVVFDVTVKDRLKKQGKSASSVSNPDFHYSGIQHDNLAYHHDIGQALFLEEPYEMYKEQYKDEIASALKNVIRRTKWTRRSGGWSKRGSR